MDRRRFIATALAAPFFARSAVASPILNVVATTGMIADAARAVGGSAVSVTALMGSGVDPHGYRQTRSDIVAMSRADLVLWNGLYLEAQLEEFLAKLARKTKVVAVAEAAPENMLLAHEDYAGRADPHIWMVPDLWQYAVREVEAAMTATQPESAALFAENAAVYLETLQHAGDYAKRALSQIPQDSRVLISAHDAFGYFGRAYGFDVMGIQGISTESEAGLQRIRELVDMIVARDIKAVFVESSVSDRNVRALIEGAAAQGHDVQIGGELFSDAMGADGTYEGTYIGMIDHNATTIARALGVDVPAGGMAGKLSAGS